MEKSKIFGRIVELNNAPYADGRREITLMLHELHPDEAHYNRNGICWLESYVMENAGSIVNMPLCVRYLSEEEGIPYDHGLTDTDGPMPVFDGSYVVGVCTDYMVTEHEDLTGKHRVLCARGILYQQRYPRFVAWLEERLARGEAVYSSVEIVAARGNDGVVYRDGWKPQGRIPTQYTYSGHAFLTVQPSDDQSLVLELNEQNRKTEGQEMTEQELAKITSAVCDTINACGKKAEDAEAMKAAHEAELAERDARIAQLEAEAQEAKAALLAKEAELAQATARMAEKEAAYTQVCTELEAARNAALGAELEQMLGAFTKEEVAFATEEVGAFKENPTGCGYTIEQIKTKIEACAYQALRKQRSVLGEQNQADFAQVFEGMQQRETAEVPVDFTKAF